MKNKRLKFILLTVVILLLLPLIAMQFSEEVDWNLLDFIIAGILLTVTGLMIELVLRKIIKIKHRIIIIVVFLIILLLIWAELAVGIFGTSFGGS